jgi:hypothetical protein
MAGGLVRALLSSLPALTDGQASLPALDNQGRLRTFADVPGTPFTKTQSAANSSCVINTPNVVGKTTFLQGFCVTGLGATAAGAVVMTIAQLNDAGTISFDIGVPAGVLVPITPLIVNFQQPLQAQGVNTLIQLTVPAFGAGNTSVHMVAWGFLL